MIAFRLALVSTMLALTACAGLIKPIERRVETESGTEKENSKKNQVVSQDWAAADTLSKHYGNPLNMAYERIHDWDDAMSNIQNANSGSIGVLAPLAALVGYRAARGKSNAATAALAAGGLAGMSLADTFVQVGRLQVYEQGIFAMECAIATYKSVEILPNADLSDSGILDDTESFAQSHPVRYLKEYGDPELNAWVAATEADTNATLDGARQVPQWLFAKAVSRITHEVHQAVMGSIVSVQSTSTALTTAFTPSSPAVAAPPSTGNAGVKLRGHPSTKEAREANIESAKEAVNQRNINAHAVVANAGVSNAALETRLSGCALTVHTTTPEVASPSLAVQAISASAPFSVKNGDTLSFRVFGGRPNYRATVVPATEGISVSLAQQDGIFILTLKATKVQSAAVSLQLIVTDDANASASTDFSFKPQ